jgi:hypothetical protein
LTGCARLREDRAMRAPVLCLALVLLGGVARGEADATVRARRLYQEGVRDYNIGRYAHALESFRAGYVLDQRSGFLVNIGQCERALGMRKEAIRSYRRYLAEEPASPNRAEVEEIIASLERELASSLKQVAPPPRAASVVEPPPPRRRVWPWVALAALVVVAGAAVAVAVVARPVDAAVQPGTFGSTVVRFP